MENKIDYYDVVGGIIIGIFLTVGLALIFLQGVCLPKI